MAFTRDPATGAPGVYGDYLTDAQGEDVVAGIRNTVPLTELERLDPASFHRACGDHATLERHYATCATSSSIERGRLWMLQTRVGKRTAAAGVRDRRAAAEEGVITADEALTRVSGESSSPS
ncbi:hypothetical protein [Micromonospora sp. b486]|uniref:hypothetical protein n=1 Tax=Micromonospora sp. b486 TaxID=3053986 RepID=UPI00338FC969